MRQGMAETLNIVSGKHEVMALLPHAWEGYLAGCNMAG